MGFITGLICGFCIGVIGMLFFMSTEEEDKNLDKN